jgi:hypothetical protein
MSTSLTTMLSVSASTFVTFALPALAAIEATMIASIPTIAPWYRPFRPATRPATQPPAATPTRAAITEKPRKTAPTATTTDSASPASTARMSSSGIAR